MTVTTAVDKILNFIFLEFFFQKSVLKNSNVRVGARQAGVGHCLRFSFWLTFLKNLSIMPLGVFHVIIII